MCCMITLRDKGDLDLVVDHPGGIGLQIAAARLAQALAGAHVKQRFVQRALNLAVVYKPRLSKA